MQLFDPLFLYTSMHLLIAIIFTIVSPPTPGSEDTPPVPRSTPITDRYVTSAAVSPLLPPPIMLLPTLVARPVAAVRLPWLMQRESTGNE